jgi:predicted Zn-dependent peptidase
METCPTYLVATSISWEHTAMGETGGSLDSDWRLAADHRAVTLSNGVRLITVARPGTPTVVVRVYVRAGSRYDVEEKHAQSRGPPLGLAHLTEHLLFKGTRSRSQREIFASVERLGGALDGGTTKEYATLCAVMPRRGLGVALEVLGELLTEPAFREQDFWNEKLVVLEEIRRARDQQSVIYDLFVETLWRRHPFRHPIRGTLETLRDLDHEAVLAFHQGRYVAGNMLLAVCGDIGHEEVRRLAAETFGSLPAGVEQRPVPVHEPPLTQPRSAHLSKDIGQTLLLVGAPTVGMKHDDRGPLKVIERVLGMGASARLYQRLREDLRLVYSVRTVTAHYEDAGTFAVQTACDPQKAVQVQQAVLEEWQVLRQQGVTEEELSAAKSNYAGTQARRFETNRALAGIFGVEALLHRIEPFEEALSRINAVRRDDVVRVAEKYLDQGRVVRVSLGRG